MKSKYSVEGTIKRTEALKMLVSIQRLCKKFIPNEHSIRSDKTSWTYWEFIDSELKDSKSYLVSKKIKRLYVLKLLWRIYMLSDSMISAMDDTKFSDEFNMIIVKYGYDHYMIHARCTKQNWLDAESDSRIKIVYLNYLNRTMAWGNKS